MENCLPAIYRTADAIDNLLLKVTLNKKQGSIVPTISSSSTSGPSSSSTASSTTNTNNNVTDLTNVHSSNSNDTTNNGADQLSIEIAWQQKIFGPR